MSKFLVSTTNEIAGHTIEETVGVVFSDVVVGANAFKDFMSKIRDFTGGRVSGYEASFNSARKYGIEEIMESSKKSGANAIINLDFQFTSIGERGSILGVFITGTAVKVVKNNK